MRFIASILSPLILAGILLCASIAAAPADDSSGADVARQVRREWYELANNRTEFEVSDPALLPKLLVLAVEQSSCDYKDRINELPVHFISVERRRLAIVFCHFGVSGSHQMFDLADLRKPKLMELTFIARKDGFGTTPRPGMITWKRDAGVLEAETGADTCPRTELRHTYRPGFTAGWVSEAATFVVVRVEVRENRCGGQFGSWTTIWEAPTWSELSR